MRRPLCTAALLFAALLLIWLQLCPPQYPDYRELDRRTLTAVGTVVSKDHRLSEDGALTLLITLKDVQIMDSSSENTAKDTIPGENVGIVQVARRVLVRVQVMDSLSAENPALSLDHAEAASPIGARINVRGKVRCFQEATNPGEFDARLYYRTRGYDLQMSNAEILTDHSSCNAIDNTASRIKAKGMNIPTAMNTGGGMNSCPIKKDHLRDGLYRIRCRGSSVLRRCLSAEDASVLQAMLLGEKGYLSNETKRLYQQNGIIHILAISGLHISVIGMGIYRLLRLLLEWLYTFSTSLRRKIRSGSSSPRTFPNFLSPSSYLQAQQGPHTRVPYSKTRRKSCTEATYVKNQHVLQAETAFSQNENDPLIEYIRTERFLCLQQWISGSAAILFMILYGLMTSAGASAVRAIIMFALHIRAIRIRRTYDMLAAVSVAAVLILIQEPLYLYDSGFLFSFSAVIAIGALLPSLKGKILKTLAVPLGTLPVCIRFNSFFPIWSVLINLLVLPMMGLLLPIGFLVLLLGLLSVKLGILAGTAAHVILLSYYALCRMAQRLPGSILVTGSCSTLQIFLYLICLVAAAYIGSSYAEAHHNLSSFNLIRSVKLLLRSGNDPLRRKSSRRSAGRLCTLQQNTIYIAIMEVLCKLNCRAHMQFHKLFSRFYLTTCKVQKKRSFTPLWQSLLIAFGIAILLYRPARGLSIHVIDVGQGDGILIQYEETAFRKGTISEKPQKENKVPGTDVLNGQQSKNPGNTSFFQKRTKTAIMIDGGSTDKQNLAQYQLEPFLRYQGCSVIDCWIITHDDSDHCSGLLQILEDPETFRTVQIRQILLPASAKSEVNTLLPSSSTCEENALLPFSSKSADHIEVPSASYGEKDILSLSADTGNNNISASEGAKVSNYPKIVSLAQAHSIPVGFIKKGDVLTNGQLSLTCLHPSDNSAYSEPNEESVVLYLQYGAFDALFTGDLEGAGERDLLKNLSGQISVAASVKKMPAQVFSQSDNDSGLYTEDTAASLPISLDLLKVAHHGSSGATSEAFLTYFQPKKAVISCGRNNRYGHPHRETMERLSEAGADVLQTKVCGEITYNTDGKYLTVRPFLSK